MLRGRLHPQLVAMTRSVTLNKDRSISVRIRQVR